MGIKKGRKFGKKKINNGMDVKTIAKIRSRSS
jgi:hypothetical protein